MPVAGPAVAGTLGLQMFRLRAHLPETVCVQCREAPSRGRVRRGVASRRWRTPAAAARLAPTHLRRRRDASAASRRWREVDAIDRATRILR